MSRNFARRRGRPKIPQEVVRRSTLCDPHVVTSPGGATSQSRPISQTELPPTNRRKNIENLRKELAEDGFVKVLYHAAHRQLSPRSSRPAYNILGFFPDLASRDRHVNKIRNAYRNDYALEHGTTDGFTLPATICGVNVLDYFLIPTSLEKQRSTYCPDKIEIIKNIYYSAEAAHQKEFEANVTANKTGDQGKSFSRKRMRKKTKVRRRVRRKAFDATAKREQWEGIADVPTSVDLRNQKCCVVVHLLDNTEDALAGRKEPEPAILPICPAPDQDAAWKWIDDTGSQYINRAHMDVVTMGCYIHPEDVDTEALRENYRNETVQNIMDARKDKKKELSAFEEWCEENEMSFPEMIVTEESDATVLRAQPDGTLFEVVPGRGSFPNPDSGQTDDSQS